MYSCKDCDVILAEQNWYKSNQNKRIYSCNKCYLAYQRNISKQYRIFNKEAALNICGGSCVCCAENIIDFLNIDHINGSGKDDRKSGLNATRLHKVLATEKYDNLNNLRTLCYNCNCAMGAYGYCSHNFKDISNNCFSCGIYLIEREIGKANIKQNHHPFFKNSGINICFDCAFKNKVDTVAISTEQRENRMAKLNRRTKVIEGYGGSCECCGESNYIFLTVDHINNHDDGLKGQPLYRYLIKNNFPRDNYRLLCYNCNCGRGHNGSDGICPHQKPDAKRIIMSEVNIAI